MWDYVTLDWKMSIHTEIDIKKGKIGNVNKTFIIGLNAIH